MEDTRPLALVCKHLAQETRDETLTRMMKQKHAAHAATHRLRKKVRELELAVSLLAAVWTVTERHNAIMNARIDEIVSNAKKNIET